MVLAFDELLLLLLVAVEEELVRLNRVPCHFKWDARRENEGIRPNLPPPAAHEARQGNAKTPRGFLASWRR